MSKNKNFSNEKKYQKITIYYQLPISNKYQQNCAKNCYSH